MTDTPWSILNARITRVIDRLDALPTFREATVAATSPLAVRFDTDSADTLVFATLVSGLAVGDRVLTLRFGRLPWVIGRRGGQVDTGWADLSLESGWSASANYAPPRWRLTGDRRLVLDGRIAGSSSSSPTVIAKITPPVAPVWAARYTGSGSPVRVVPADDPSGTKRLGFLWTGSQVQVNAYWSGEVTFLTLPSIEF